MEDPVARKLALKNTELLMALMTVVGALVDTSKNRRVKAAARDLNRWMSESIGEHDPEDN